MTEFALRIKTKTGQKILKNLTSNSTIRDLKVQLANMSSIPQERLHLLSGFPPKAMDISRDDLELSKSGLVSGDTVILEERDPPVIVQQQVQPDRPEKVQTSPAHPGNTAQQDRIIGEDEAGAQSMARGILLKKVVPADNSCLFSSVYFVLNGKLDESGSAAKYMRQLIAETIAQDPHQYSDAVLGKSNADYCKWIQDDKTWGGAIEIRVLSDHYGIEIAVVDTGSGSIQRFGESSSFGNRVFLLFDGIHYDPLYMESLDGSENRTIFSSDDAQVLKQAEEIGHEAKSSRQFTDLNRFTLKCLICDVKLKGQLEAREHAQNTGHTNFGEV